MIKRILRLYILFFLLLAAGGFVFADEPASSLDDKPSVDTVAVVGGAQSASPASEQAMAGSASQTSYLYDLKKLIEKSRENIKRVNEKIKEQAVLKRNQKREERAREYYEKGVALVDEGKFDEAREYFEKAISITEHPEMVGYVKESQRRLKKQEHALSAQENERLSQIKHDEESRRQEVEQAYKEAVALYKEKKYHPAQDAFKHVEEIVPDYRATASYLKIIEENIIIADGLAAKQQKVEISRQQKEAEAARAKEKEMWRREIEAKEKERKDQINKQAQEEYELAISLFNQKKYAEAKKKFEEVSWVVPDYKATLNYLHRIDKDAQDEKQRVADEQQKALQESRWEEEVARKKAEIKRQHELEIKERQQRQQLEEQAQFLYKAALALFDKNSLDEALEKFNDIEKTCPGYKSTRIYIARIKQWQLEQQKRKEEEQRRQLESEVNGIYISALNHYKAREFEEAKKEFLKVDEKIPDYKSTRKYLSQLGANVPPPGVKSAVSLEDQQKQARDIAALAQKSEQLYRQIANVADDKTTIAAKRKMAQVDEIINNVKEQQERLLNQMRQEQWHQQQQEAKTQEEQSRFEAEQLKQMQEKGKIEALQRSQKEQEEERLSVQKQQVQLALLASKASDINDDIIRLSKEQNYAAMKAKFEELEKTVLALTTLKSTMAQEKDRWARGKQLGQESRRHLNETIAIQKQQDKGIHANAIAPQKENVPVLSPKPDNGDQNKRREIMREQSMLFSEAVDCYRHKKYTQARLLFVELAQQHDRRSEAWLKKVDRANSDEILKNKESQEREHTAFIAEQLRAQRKLIVIQERERERQRKLTEELERQKLLYEEDRLLQRQKQQVLKAQERERQLQEEQRLKSVANPQQKTPAVQESVMSPEQEKLYLEKKHREELNGQQEQQLEEKIKQAQIVREATKRKAELQRQEREREAKLNAQREALRKQLEDGVNVMYQEALRLYKQGKYTAAAQRFKDIQDILPGYKRASQYMDEARLKAETALKSQAQGIPDTSVLPGTSNPPSASSSATRQDTISKTLDLFDPNVVK